MHSPIIRHVDVDGTLRRGDLYETFAALSAGTVDHFPALRSHQSEMWHIFCVQIAVHATERAGLERPPVESQEWRCILHALTPRWPAGEPWQLTVDDLDAPALLQPAIAAAEIDPRKKTPATSPDEIDVIVAGRNHEIKSGAFDEPQDDDWLFALVTLQTSEGCMGAGTQGVSRINGGYASRTTMRLVPDGGASAGFLRDVAILLRTRRENPPPSGPVLLWTEPWKGKPDVSFDALSLDPLYVEICRRIRLIRQDGRTAAVRTGSTSALVRSERGMTACPWTPIVLTDREPKSFSPGPVDDYRVPATLIDRVRTARPLLADAHPEDAEGGEIRISGMRRGQGATERFDLYRIAMPDGDAISAMARIDGHVPQTADAYAKAWNILRTALTSARQGAPERIRFDDTASSAWADEARQRYAEQVKITHDDGEWPEMDVVRRQAAALARRTFDERTAMLPGARTPRGIATAARSAGLLGGMLDRFIKGDEDDK